jgi:hypothetical protein
MTRWLCAGALALVSSCSTQYTPEPSPRISVVMVGGMPAYQKNGETISHGFAGSGLVEAVEDDPEALDAAETYHGRSVGGLIAVLGGLACGIGGVAVIASDDSGGASDERTAIGGAALVCMLGATIAGLVLISTAQPYQWDAINIYNDNVERRRRRYWYPAYPPPPRPATALPPPPPAPPPPPPTVPATPADAGADSG